MSDVAIRFVVGGSIVSAFAIIGDILKPKSFAGLFGAAPFGLTRNAAPHDLCQRSNIRGRRSARDDRRRDRAIYLCELRQLRVDAVQDARACCERTIHPALAGCSYWLATGLSKACGSQSMSPAYAERRHLNMRLDFCWAASSPR